MITLGEAKRRQAELQARGQRLLDSFDIVDQLSLIGEIEIQGSFAAGLMVKPDIDIYVLNESPSLRAVADLAREITMLDGTVRVMTVNFLVNSSDPGTPKGVYLGVRRLFEGEVWNFDIWVISPNERLDLENFPPQWHTKLTPAMHDAALLMKYQLTEQGLYPRSSKVKGSIASAEIYRAVMNDGIKSTDDLKEWQKSHSYY